MVWTRWANDHDHGPLLQISSGDIFKDAPAADAIVRAAMHTNGTQSTAYASPQVSPANSFGFMDGGIDMAYSLHFGWQMCVSPRQPLLHMYGT